MIIPLVVLGQDHVPLSFWAKITLLLRIWAKNLKRRIREEVSKAFSFKPIAHKFPLGATIKDGKHILGINHGLLAKPEAYITKEWKAWNQPTMDDNKKVDFMKFHRKTFHRFGVAYQLYFKLVCHLGLLMMVISVLMIPQIVIACNGNMMDDLNGSWLLDTMLGNFGTMPLIEDIGGLIIDAVDPDDEEAKYDAKNTERLRLIMDRSISVMDKDIISVKTGVTIVACIDVIMLCVCLAWAAIFFYKRIPQIVTRYDEKTWRMSDHAIIVTKIPDDKGVYDTHEDYQDMIKNHFKELSDNPANTAGTAARKEIPSDKIVDDIFVFRDDQFAKFSKCGELAREFALIHARRHNGMKERKCDKEVKKTRRAMVKTLEGTKDCPNKRHTPLVAYVTFIYSADKDYIEKKYAPYLKNDRNMPHYMQMMKSKIKVRQAPDPEAILWENLHHVGDHSRKRGFRALSWVVSVLLILTYMAATWFNTMTTVEVFPPRTTTHVAIMGQSKNNWGICDIELYRDFDCSEEYKIEFDQSKIQPYWKWDPEGEEDYYPPKPVRPAYTNCNGKKSAWSMNEKVGTPLKKKKGGSLRDYEGVVIPLITNDFVKCVMFKQKLEDPDNDDEDRELDFIIQFCSEAGLIDPLGGASYPYRDPEFDKNYICTRTSHLKLKESGLKNQITASTMFYYEEFQTKQSTKSFKDTNIEDATDEQFDEFLERNRANLVWARDTLQPKEFEESSSKLEWDWYKKCICDSNMRNLFHNRLARSWELRKELKVCESNWVQSLKWLGQFFLVHFFNELLKRWIRFMTVLEGHHSLNKFMESSFKKMFVCLYINNAVVIWFIHIKWRNTQEKDDQIDGYAEFNGLWYAHVGSAVINQSLSYIYMPILKISLQPIKFWFSSRKGLAAMQSRWKFGSYTRRKFGSYTQYDSNKANTPPEFKIDVKAASVMAIIGMTLFYGAGVPIIYPFTTIAIVAIYWCDEHAFYTSRADRTIDEYVIKGCLFVVPVLVGTHAAMAIGFYGSPLTAPSHYFNEKDQAELIENYLNELQSVNRSDIISYWTYSRWGVLDPEWSKRLYYMIFNSGSIVFFVFTILFVLASIAALIIYIEPPNPESEDDGTTILDVRAECRELGLVTSYKLDRALPHYDAALTVMKFLRDLDEHITVRPVLKVLRDPVTGPVYVTWLVEQVVVAKWRALQSNNGAQVDHRAEYIRNRPQWAEDLVKQQQEKEERKGEREDKKKNKEGAKSTKSV